MPIIEPTELPEEQGGGVTYSTPRRLYHYTSPEGLLGIVRENQLRCSAAQYLSDAQELQYAISKIIPVLREAEPRTEDEDHLLERIVTRAQGVAERRLYVGSLSVEGNLLSQWRAYCPDTGGIAVGFDGVRLLRLAEAQGFTLVKCVYDEDLHEEMVLDLVARTVRSYRDEREKGRSVSSDLFREHAVAFLAEFMELAARVKHPKFAEENEWRLVSTPEATNQQTPQFRTGASTLVPYLDFQLTSPEQPSLPLITTYIGPTPHPDIAVRSVEKALRVHAKEAQPVPVEKSGIPYRTW